MSFSVSCAGCGLEYSGRRPFAQPRERARARASSRCSGRSAAGCARRARSLERADYERSSLGDYLDERGYSQRFRRHFLVPLTSALWSTAPGRALEFPAAYAIRFFDNHGMLGLRPLPLAHGRRGGSRTLRRRDRASGSARACTSALGVRVAAARRPTASSCAPTTARCARFDRVVVATHADQALALLEDPSDDERARARRLRLHDERRRAAHRRVVPAARAAPRARPGTTASATTAAPTITYYLNRLQRLEADARLLRDAERATSPTSTCIARFAYDASALHARRRSRAQRELPRALRRRAAPGTRARTSATASTRTGSRRACARPRRSGSRGEVGALRGHADARAAHAARGTSSATRSRTWLLDLDELPELERRLRLFSHNARNVVTLPRRRPLRRRPPLKDAVLALAERPDRSSAC